MKMNDGSVIIHLARVLAEERLRAGESLGSHSVKKQRLEPELSSENQVLLSQLIERYQDTPHIKTILEQDCEQGMSLLILLLKHDVRMEQCATLFESHKAIALRQDVQAKQCELDALMACKDKEIASLHELIRTAPKLAQENDNLKQALFDLERKSVELERKLAEQTSALSGAHQARIHQVREQATQMLNDEHAKLTTHIRGELRKTPVNREALFDGINIHADAMRLVLGKCVI